MANSANLLSPAELNRLIKDNSVRVLDCSWYLPTQQIDTRQAYLDQHIPGAMFFHIDLVCDQQSDLPHMLPTPENFALEVNKLGVDNASEVVVYDSAGIFSAARVWWMFHVFGHAKVKVLNGGLPAWIEFGGDLSDTDPELGPAGSRPQFKTGFKSEFNSQMIATKAQLLSNCDAKEALVLDARSRPRFLGQAPEPRPGLASGHMPQSVSLPYDQLLDAGKLKPPEELHALFSDLGVTADTSIVTSCGSGVTAAIITLALAESGFGMHRLYDGAWSEWGAASDTVILTSESF